MPVTDQPARERHALDAVSVLFQALELHQVPPEETLRVLLSATASVCMSFARSADDATKAARLAGEQIPEMVATVCATHPERIGSGWRATQ